MSFHQPVGSDRYRRDRAAETFVASAAGNAVGNIAGGLVLGAMFGRAGSYQHNRRVAIGTGIGAIVALVATIALSIIFPPVSFVAGLALVVLAITSICFAVKAVRAKAEEVDQAARDRFEEV